MIFNMTGMAGATKSMIIVTAPTGSSVTCTMGNVIKTAVEKNGSWTFSGLENGTWTVTASLGGETASVEVAITRLSIEYVTLEYTLWLYNHGDSCDEVSGGWAASTVSTAASQSGECILESGQMLARTGHISGKQQGGFIRANNAMDLTEYSTLYFRCAVTEQVSGDFGKATITIGAYTEDKATSPSNPEAAALLTITGAEEQLYAIDISAVTGSCYIGTKSGWNKGPTTVAITEVYLKK